MNGKVLLVCYYFPPLGLAGVTRPLNLFKYLPQHGYECHVLTVKPVAYRKYEPELLVGLDQSKIFRAGSRDPQRLMYLMGIREVNPKTISKGSRLGENLFPDSKKGWVASAVRLGKRLHQEHGYNAVISTSPPISSHLVGMNLAAQTNIPWIADFRDLWTQYSIDQTYADPLLRDKAYALLAEIQQKSHTRVAVNQSIAQYVNAPSVITNGFNPEIAQGWVQPPSGEQFVIGLLGTFNDFLPVEPLFRVLRQIRESHPVLFKRVRVKQVGVIDSEWLKAQLERYELTDICECHGQLPRTATVQALAASAAMYVGVSESAAMLTTSRVYDVLASGRPILTYVPPQSELARIVVECPHAICFDESTVRTSVEWLCNLIEQHQKGELHIQAIPPCAQPYSWDNLAEQYARLIDETIR